MNYDFDKIIDRKNTNSIKWDFATERGMPEGLLSMWVADMDFTSPKEVLDDIEKAVSHGIFGYTEVKQDYYDALSDWFLTRYRFSFHREDVVKTPGVVFALAACVRAFTKPDEAILIQTPVYYPFYEVIRSNGRRLITNPLIYKDGAYSIDFDDFEHKIAENGIKLFILCSPHNPISRVWSRSELEHIQRICSKYDVLVVSDEIHCDFVYRPHEHTCYGLLDENAIIATAPSKTFNLAGLQVANIIVRNRNLRSLLKSEINKTGYSQLNMLGLVACQSAYTYGGEWLEKLKEYLMENIRYTREFLSENLPKIHLIEPEGTYLIWLDFSAYGLTQAELDRKIIKEAGLWLDSGTMFGAEGEGFQRINIACPRTTLETALARLAKVFSQLD
jgi:cystathionine beta-lyase